MTYAATLSTNAHGILSGSVYLPVPIYRASAFNTTTGVMAPIGTTPSIAYAVSGVLSFLTGTAQTNIPMRPSSIITNTVVFNSGNGTEAYDTSASTFCDAVAATTGFPTYSFLTYGGFTVPFGSSTRTGVLTVDCQLIGVTQSTPMGGTANASAILQYSLDNGANWTDLASILPGLDFGRQTFTTDVITTDVTQVQVRFLLEGQQVTDEFMNTALAQAEAVIWDIVFTAQS